jgi:hypothetical protein
MSYGEDRIDRDAVFVMLPAARLRFLFASPAVVPGASED